MFCPLFLENKSCFFKQFWEVSQINVKYILKRKVEKGKEKSFVNRYAFSRCAGLTEKHSQLCDYGLKIT